MYYCSSFLFKSESDSESSLVKKFEDRNYNILHLSQISNDLFLLNIQPVSKFVCGHIMREHCEKTCQNAFGQSVSLRPLAKGLV